MCWSGEQFNLIKGKPEIVLKFARKKFRAKCNWSEIFCLLELVHHLPQQEIVRYVVNHFARNNKTEMFNYYNRTEKDIDKQKKSQT